MNYPYFSGNRPDMPPTLRGEDVPTLDSSRLEDPSSYAVSKDLADAVNVALILGRPLLLTGEPGVGKTQLAYKVAYELRLPLHKFEAKSTSQAKDLFYTYDAISAFRLANEASARGIDSVQFDTRNFIEYHALGRAILEAYPLDAIAHLYAPHFLHHIGPRRAVVLIDEADKAPRDFLNDLLNEVDRLYFRVPELQRAATPGADESSLGVPPPFRPIVVITSNSERALPDAFLRRCVFFEIPFPTQNEIEEIVLARLPGIGTQKLLLRQSLDFFFSIRNASGGLYLRKPPSTAELLDWLAVLMVRGLDDRLCQDKSAVAEMYRQTLSSLVKSSEDRRTVLLRLSEF